MADDPAAATAVADPTLVAPDLGAAEGAATAAPASDIKPEEIIEQPPAPPWASVEGKEWEDLLDHEGFAPVLAKREERIRGTLHQELGTQYQQSLQAATANWAGTEMARTVGGYYGSLAEKLAEGDFEGAEKLLDKLHVVAQPYVELAKGVSKYQGGREQSDTILNHLKAELTSHKDRDAFDDILKGPAGQSWPETIKAWGKIKVEGSNAAGGKQRDKLAMDAARAELAAQQRETKGPSPGVPAGGGGGGAPVDPDTISSNTWITLPAEQREEIKARWAEHVARQG